MLKDEEVKISSVNQFFEIIEELSETYPSDVIMDVPAKTKFIFRGVYDDSFSLRPSLFRKETTESNAREKDEDYDKYSGASETEILKSFIVEASGFVHDIPSCDLYRWAVYAQHFGVPTRFLDWTSNPLTAMYFACCTQSSKNSAVWVLHTLNYRRFALKKNQEMEGATELLNKRKLEIINMLLSGQAAQDYPIIYTPFYVDQRMSAQASFFMVWGNKLNPLEELIPEENYMIVSNQDKKGVRFYGSLQEQGLLLKIIINNHAKQKILRQLDMLGINEKTLFPGLDGIGKYIERKYRFDYKESFENF